MIYIAIPNNKPPFLVDSEECPPLEDKGDKCFEGDRILPRFIELYQAPEYRGPNREKVQSLFKRYMADGGGDLVLA